MSTQAPHRNTSSANVTPAPEHAPPAFQLTVRNKSGPNPALTTTPVEVRTNRRFVVDFSNTQFTFTALQGASAALAGPVVSVSGNTVVVSGNVTNGESITIIIQDDAGNVMQTRTSTPATGHQTFTSKPLSTGDYTVIVIDNSNGNRIEQDLTI